jgi:hypothetical protein
MYEYLGLQDLFFTMRRRCRSWNLKRVSKEDEKTINKNK